MYDVMSGVRVIEVAEHTFAPVAGMVLADWGADVIKVERTPHGDSSRRLKLIGSDGAINPYFEAGNRGKRSIGLDLTQAAAREQLYQLIRGADVFLTNLRPDARKKLGIEPADLMRLNPKLIYARATGYGIKGSMVDSPGFDYPSAWCRAGASNAQTLSDSEPPKPPGSIGDLTAGATLAGAIAAALFRRERTGHGAIVDNALYQVGAFLMSQSLVGASIGVPVMIPARQIEAVIPLSNSYRTSDGRWITITILLESWWPDFVRHLDRPDLLSDPRFVDAAARDANKRALIETLNEIFGACDYAAWCQRLLTLQGAWAPDQNMTEVLNDPQALENGFVSRVEVDADTSYFTGVSPGQFDERPIGALRSAPAFAQHTDQVLRESGVSNAAISALRAAGAIQ